MAIPPGAQAAGLLLVGGEDGPSSVPTAFGGILRNISHH